MDDWHGAPVLARVDQNGPYCAHNCYWRPANTEREAEMGLEEWLPGEPEYLPMTPAEAAERKQLKTERELWLFDIWRRFRWRMRVSRGTN
jgi:hypothetical protein